MGEPIEFSQLKTEECALVDIGSAYDFFSPDSTGFLTGQQHQIDKREIVAKKYGDSAADALFPNILKAVRDSHSESLRLLEQIIVHGTLVVDEAVTDGHARFQLAHDRMFALLESPWFRLCKIPMDVRKTAAQEIVQNRSYVKSFGKKLRHVGSDKVAHDNLFENRIYCLFCFADSPDAPERALYYLSIARQSGAPLVVSSNKQEQLKIFTRSIRKHVHEYLSTIAIESSNSSGIDNVLSGYQTPLPPIQEMIIAFAYHNAVSPLVAFKEIYNSEEAKAYRKLIRRLSQLLIGNLGDRTSADQELLKIRKEMERWKNYPYITRFRTSCQLNLQEIPRIDWLTKATGRFSNISIPDLRLHPLDSALVFMSRWFRSSSRQTYGLR